MINNKIQLRLNDAYFFTGYIFFIRTNDTKTNEIKANETKQQMTLKTKPKKTRKSK